MRGVLLVVLTVALACAAAGQDLSTQRAEIKCGACQLAVGRITWELLEAFGTSTTPSQAVCRHPNEDVAASCGAQMPELRESLHFGALQACYIGGSCAREGDAKDDDVLQRSALEQLFMLTGGPLSWRRRGGWLAPDRSYCSWEGVKCDPSSRQVVGLALADNGLQGGLHGFVPQHLPALSSLRLEQNKLSAMSSWWSPPAALKDCNMAGNLLTTPPPRAAARLCGASSAVVVNGLGKRNAIFPAPIPTNGSFPLHGGGDISWGSIYAPIYQGKTNGSRDDIDNDNDNNNNNNDDNNNNNNNGLVVMGDNNTVEYENYNVNINLNLNHNGNANHNSNSSGSANGTHHHYNGTGPFPSFNTSSSRKALISGLTRLATLMQRSDWDSLVEAFNVAASVATSPRHHRKQPASALAADVAARAARDESTEPDPEPANNSTNGGNNNNHKEKQHGAPPQQMDDGGVFNVDSIFGPIFGGDTNGDRTDVDNDNDNNNNNNGDNNNDNNNQLYISGSNNAIKYKNKNINFNFNPNWNDNNNDNRDV